MVERELLLPDVHYGEVKDEEPSDELPKLEDETDDDEPLKVTPPDVVEILGFDPLDEDD